MVAILQRITAVDPSDANDVLAECRAAAPGVDVDSALFLAYLAARSTDASTSVHATDLYLAFACGERDAAALQLFFARYRPIIEHALRGLDARTREDAKQLLDQRLFVGPAPKISTYSGRGPLGAWLRVIATRIRIELVGKDPPLADALEIGALEGSDDSPELAYLKARYRADYKRAFADALGSLGERERTILAQYHVDGLTIDQLGALYNVHRVTASRWVTRAEEQLRDQLFELLQARLGLGSHELRSVTRLVRSKLSVRLTP